MPKFPLPAGEGEHKIYPILVQNSLELKNEEHYLSMYASSWYVNKESNWFSDRTITGTLSFQVPGNDKKFDVGLGTYELKGGAKFAPIFNKEVFPATRFKFNNITLQAFFHGIKKDTQLTKILKSSGDASLNIISGLANSASFASATQPLVAAGTNIVSGIQEIIQNADDKKFRIFDSYSGLSETMIGDQIKSFNEFRLLHRGTVLDLEKLGIRQEGSINIPTYESQPLEDGAWILIEMKLTKVFPYERPWYKKYEKLGYALEDIVEEVIILDSLDKEEALMEFGTSKSSKPTLYDRYIELRGTIKDDHSLIKSERATFSLALREKYLNSKKAIIGNDKKILDNSSRNAFEVLSGKKEIDPNLEESLYEIYYVVDKSDGAQQPASELGSDRSDHGFESIEKVDVNKLIGIGNTRALKILLPRSN